MRTWIPKGSFQFPWTESQNSHRWTLYDNTNVADLNSFNDLILITWILKVMHWQSLQRCPNHSITKHSMPSLVFLSTHNDVKSLKNEFLFLDQHYLINSLLDRLIHTQLLTVQKIAALRRNQLTGMKLGG